MILNLLLMSVKGKPKLTPFTGSDYTRVTFWPDFKKFSMTKLDDDIAGTNQS